MILVKIVNSGHIVSQIETFNDSLTLVGKKVERGGGRNQLNILNNKTRKSRKKLNILKKKMAEDGNNQWDGARRGKS